MKTNNIKGFTLLGIIFGLVGFLMIFFPAMAFSNSDSSFLGYEIAFGTEFVNLGSWASGQIVPNILSMLAYILPLAAIVALLLAKKATVFSIILFSVGLVLLFLMPLYTVTTVSVLGTTNEINVDWVMSFGLIIAIVASVGGLLTGIVKIIFESSKQ